MPDEARRPARKPRPATRRVAVGLLLLLACVLSSSATARAQFVFREDFEAAPPPMRYVPAPERAMLRGERDFKSRVRLGLRFAEARLARAAQYTDAGFFEAASAELGIYEALVEDAVRHLRSAGRSDNNQLDLCKRLEMTLRQHGPRIETIRRMTPSEYSVHVRAAYERVRAARAAALEVFYGSTVMQEPPPAQTAAPPRHDSAPRRTDSFARLHAAYDLIADRSKAVQAMPLLVELLKSDEAYIRGNAAHCLGLLGPEAEQAVPALIDLLKDRNSLVRFSAAEAIRRIGMAAVPALNRVTQSDK